MLPANSNSKIVVVTDGNIQTEPYQEYGTGNCGEAPCTVFTEFKRKGFEFGVTIIPYGADINSPLFKEYKKCGMTEYYDPRGATPLAYAIQKVTQILIKNQAPVIRSVQYWRKRISKAQGFIPLIIIIKNLIKRIMNHEIYNYYSMVRRR